ncbi:hypothetical protein [Clostridium sp. BL-8]|uniref:hypothetical protein n=1 Tax=Clostridium sp. BL-8 TaxID=349938 RepID=UPI00098C1E89|nr:hypothetical protein [Clostridium sp. BL-8]OOM79978.1 hypothetical protein CLOBL_13460 [Clostridium sp. BL-8]
MISLRQQLEEYESTIVDLIEGVKENQELSDLLLRKKNNLLKEIKEAKYDEEEIRRNLDELNIPAIENELELTIKKEMVKIKKKIENIRTAKLARRNYKSLQQEKFVLFRGKA